MGTQVERYCIEFCIEELSLFCCEEKNRNPDLLQLACVESAYSLKEYVKHVFTKLFMDFSIIIHR